MVLMGFVLQMPSFRHIFQSKSANKYWKRIFKGKIPKTDAAVNILSKMDCTEANSLLKAINHKLYKNKVIRRTAIDSLTIAAIDGVELFSSIKKKYPNCSKRVLENGNTEYFKRSVVCMTVGKDPHIVLGQTVLTSRDSSQKDEGENTGAKRLIKQLKSEYGHFADVIVGDALYMNAPFINTVIECGMDVIIRAKNEKRLIIQDALGILKMKKSEDEKFYRGKNNNIEVKVYVVKDLEMVGVKDINGKAKEITFYRFIEKDISRSKSKEKELWAICSGEYASKTVCEIMHKRWDIENNGFHQLKTYYHADHCFCTKAIDNVFILNVIAFNLREAYLFSHIHNFRLLNIARIDVTEIFKQDLLIDSLMIYFRGG